MSFNHSAAAPTTRRAPPPPCASCAAGCSGLHSGRTRRCRGRPASSVASSTRAACPPPSRRRRRPPPAERGHESSFARCARRGSSLALHSATSAYRRVSADGAARIGARRREARAGNAATGGEIEQDELAHQGVVSGVRGGAAAAHIDEAQTTVACAEGRPRPLPRRGRRRRPTRRERRGARAAPWSADAFGVAAAARAASASGSVESGTAFAAASARRRHAGVACGAGERLQAPRRLRAQQVDGRLVEHEVGDRATAARRLPAAASPAPTTTSATSGWPSRVRARGRGREVGDAERLAAPGRRRRATAGAAAAGARAAGGARTAQTPWRRPLRRPPATGARRAPEPPAAAASRRPRRGRGAG